MPKKVIEGGIEGLRSLIGTVLGTSDSFLVDQAFITAFADATGDHQWIHVDPEKAAAEAPWGGTITHGYSLLAKTPELLASLVDFQGVGVALNYGANEVRFPSPCKVNSKVTMTAEVAGLAQRSSGQLATFRVTFQVEGEPKPCCVAEVLYLFM